MCFNKKIMSIYEKIPLECLEKIVSYIPRPRIKDKDTILSALSICRQFEFKYVIVEEDFWEESEITLLCSVLSENKNVTNIIFEYTKNHYKLKSMGYVIGNLGHLRNVMFCGIGEYFKFFEDKIRYTINKKRRENIHSHVKFRVAYRRKNILYDVPTNGRKRKRH